MWMEGDYEEKGHDPEQTEILDLDLKEIKKEAETIIEKENKLRNATKPHSTPLTLKWLEENYEIAEGVCIPRSTLYLHYLHFCEQNDSQPVNAASFGKIIRQQFPQITTRRLGTRGQSKYHYYGIGIKDNSAYYELMYSKHGVQNSIDGRRDSPRQSVTYSPRSKLGTLLPEFPDVSELKLPPDIEENKVSTFLMMYRTHCQRILDTVVRTNFEEIQSFLLHFWQGMPAHIVPLLGCRALVSLVGVCDHILYKSITGVLMPTVLQALPDSLSQVVRTFSRQLEEWLRVALEDLPQTLATVKFNLARRFTQMLRRQISLNQLCQAARTVTLSQDMVCQMVEDWGHIDLRSICRQTLYTMDSYSLTDHDVIIKLYREFEQLLEEHTVLEGYSYWLDSLVDRCVVQPSSKKPSSLRRYARQFLLMWSCFGTRVIRDLTLHSAPSFGSFHLLHLMFDEYVLYQVENVHTQERANELLRSLRGDPTSQGESLEENSLLSPVVLARESSVQGASPHYSGTQSTQQQECAERQSVIADSRLLYTNTGYSSHSGHASQSSCDVTSELNLQPVNYSHQNPLTAYSETVDYPQTTQSAYTYNSCTQHTNKYQYPGRTSQKTTASSHWPDTSYHRYSYLLSSSQPGHYSNYDAAAASAATDYSNMYNTSYQVNACATPSTTRALNGSTHFQQGVIYSPYNPQATTHHPPTAGGGGSTIASPAEGLPYCALDNNNEQGKRKLLDASNANLAAKRLHEETTYDLQQYATNGT